MALVWSPRILDRNAQLYLDPSWAKNLFLLVFVGPTDKMKIQVHIDWQDTYKSFHLQFDWCACNKKNHLHIINENGPEGLLEIPRLTIFHLQAWGRSEQGCTSKILAKCSYQLMPVSSWKWVKITHRLFRSEKLSLTLNCSFFAKSNSIVSCSIPKIRRNISQDLAGGET